MTNIILETESGTRTVTLDYVVSYRPTKKTVTPFFKLPNEQYAHISHGARTTIPKTYYVVANVSEAVRKELDNLEADRVSITFSDGVDIEEEICLLDNVEATFRSGYEDRPWRVTLLFTSTEVEKDYFLFYNDDYIILDG